jgi:hypothetical protein
VVAADKYGNFYIVPDNGAVDPSSINERGGVTINAARGDYNPEVIKVQLIPRVAAQQAVCSCASKCTIDARQHSTRLAVYTVRHTVQNAFVMTQQHRWHGISEEHVQVLRSSSPGKLAQPEIGDRLDKAVGVVSLNFDAITVRFKPPAAHGLHKHYGMPETQAVSSLSCS